MKTQECVQVRLTEAVPVLAAVVFCLLLISGLQPGFRNPNLAAFSGGSIEKETLTSPQVKPQQTAQSWLGAAAYNRLPISFEANHGQTDSSVKFLSRGPGYSLFLTSNQAVLRLPRDLDKLKQEHGDNLTAPRRSTLSPERGENDARTRPSDQADAVLRMKFLNANPSAAIAGVDKLPARSNYFVGDDPLKWRTNIQQYGRVEYRKLYPGIDLIFHGDRRQLEFDFVVAPGGDTSRIRMSLHGADKIAVASSGDLDIRIADQVLRLHKPLVYQEVGGVKNPIAAKYRILRHGEIDIDVALYDHRDPLVIDPQLSYSALLGGRFDSQANAIAVDAAGNAYVTGTTSASDFPTVAPLQATKGLSSDVFITKISPSGTLIYSTFLGGSLADEGRGIALDPSGNIYVTGTTQSTNFPVMNAFQPTNRGGFREAFVAKLNASGSALVYSSYIGGSDQEIATAIAVDPAGNAYLTGYTQSADFPTTAGALQTAFGGGTCFTNRPCADAFVTKVASNGALIYSTFLGGSDNDNLDFLSNPAGGIAADSSGNAYVTGLTSSKNFPTRSPLQAGPNGFADAFVAKLNPTGSALLFSTYLGGSFDDIGRAIAVDSSGNAYLTGSTVSPDFPTVNPAQAAFGGGFSSFISNAPSTGDAFVVKIDRTGSAIVYSTFLGGASDDGGYGIAIDSSGAAYVAGFTDSPNFPTVDPVQSSGGGGLFRSTNAASGWNRANAGLTTSDVKVLQIDPTTPSTLYAATGRGVFKSTDSGRNWQTSGVGIGEFSIYALQIDPTTPSILYAGTFKDVFKSVNGGTTWSPTNIGANSDISGIRTIAVDPKNPMTLYVGTYQTGVFKSTNGGGSWNKMNNGLPANPVVNALLVDPAAPSTIYAGLQLFGTKAAYKSIDGGNSWTIIGTGLPNQQILGLAFDPTNSSIVYAITAAGFSGGGVYKTSNGGAGWNQIFVAQSDILSIAVDPRTPSNIYIGSASFRGAGLGILKTDNGGRSWGLRGLNGTPIQTIAIDPQTSSTLYAGTAGGSDAFVTVLNPAGKALLASSYFGGTGLEEGRGIGVDSQGNTYLVGLSFSDDFPVLSAFQASADHVPDAFAAKIVPIADAGQLLGPVPGATWTRFVRVDTNQNGVPDPGDEVVTFRYFRGGTSPKMSFGDDPSNQTQSQQPTLVIQSSRWGVTNLVLSNPDAQGRFQTATRTTRSAARNRRTFTATVDAFDSQHRPTSVSLRQDYVKGTSTTTSTGRITSVDANGDGIPEAFTAQETGQPAITVSLVFVDVNGDGRPDFVTIPFAIAGLLGAVTGDPQVFVPLGDTNGDGIPDSPAFDFDNDGKPDADFLMAPFAAGPNATQQQLFFAHFGNGSVPGAQIFSQIMLMNLDAGQPAVSRISLADDLGRALSVRLNDELVSGSKDVTIPPGGMRTLRTDGQGPITAGAVTVGSNRFLAGVILFGGSIGLAGVGSSDPLITSLVAPMEVNSAQAINTGIAMMNLEASDVTADLQLLDTEGKLLATSRLDGANALKGNGHLARFLSEFSWSPSVDFSSFVGVLRITASGRVAATVLQTRPGEFATMPVSPANADLSNQQLYFAHFGNGEVPGAQIFSQIMLINLDSARAASARILIRNDAGQPLTSNLNGELVAGQKDLVIPAGGMRILKTDAKGPLTAGAVTVSSDRKLAGVIIFGGSLGLAGVGSSVPLSNGLVAPMETNADQVINTGIAMMNLESVDVTADLQLLDTDGNQVATSRLDGANSLKGNGHLARFLQEFSWSPSVDLAKFVGVLKIKPSGRVAATVLQVRPAQFATMPVAPRLN